MSYTDIYVDLESILFRCFLTEPVTIAGIPILFKNVTESEFEYINDTYFFVEDTNLKFDYYVVYSFLQIEGRNILPEREELLDELLEIVRGWPPETYYEISSLMYTFKRRTEKAVSLLEAYSYTDYSRVKWFTYRHKLLNSPQVTGWKGTDQLGLSSTQQSWITLNHLEDERHRYDSVNDAARFVATVFNYKGMKPINDEELSKRKRELQRRSDLVAKVESEHLKSNANDEAPVDFTPPEKRKDMSAKELIDELNFALSGKEDEHMRIVGAYEREAKRLFLEEKKKKEHLMIQKMESDPRLNPLSAPIQSSSRFMSDEELEQEINNREKEKVAEEAKLNSTPLPFEPRIQRNFGMMAKLSPEEEAELNKNLLDSLPGIMKEPKSSITNNNFIKSNTIQAPTFEDIVKQQQR